MKNHKFALFACLASILLSPLPALAQSAVDRCIDQVDALDLTAGNYGLQIADQRAAKKASADCKQALSEAPDSSLVQLSYAKSLIWNDETTGALVQLEKLRGSDVEDDAVSVIGAMCANGVGSARVQTTTCDWAVEDGIADAPLALAAAKDQLSKGNSENGIQFYAQAAISGEPEAARMVNGVCRTFDINNPAQALAGISSLANADPMVAVATFCEAAYINASAGTAEWADYGFKYSEAMVFFDGYDAVADVLYDLGQSSDPAIFGDAVNVADSLCTALAGDPQDPDYGAEGVPEIQLIPANALPVCEAAAFLWPDNGRLHYNLARTYNMMGSAHQADADSALQEAINLGYPLAQSLTAPSPLNFDISKFNMPALVQAFYDNDLASLNQEPYYTLVYVSGVNDFLKEQSLFYCNTCASLQLDLDADLGHKAMVKITRGGLMEDVVGKGLESMFGPLIAIANARQSGATVMGEVNASMDAIIGSPMVMAERIRKMAEQDAKRLAILYDTNPNDVRRVYAGMVKYVEN